MRVPLLIGKRKHIHFKDGKVPLFVHSTFERGGQCSSLFQQIQIHGIVHARTTVRFLIAGQQLLEEPLLQGIRRVGQHSARVTPRHRIFNHEIPGRQRPHGLTQERKALELRGHIIDHGLRGRLGVLEAVIVLAPKCYVAMGLILRALQGQRRVCHVRQGRVL